MTVWIHSPFDNLPHEGFRRQRYWLMAEAFARAGDDVVYWTSDFNHGTKATRVLSAAVDGPSVALRLVPTPRYAKNVCVRRIFSHLFYARRFAASARAAVAGCALPRPDLIVSATPTLGAATVCLKLARATGARFVLDIQDAWPETFGRLLPSPLRGLGRVLFAPMRRAARRLYREADVVTGVSARYAAVCGRADYRVFPHGIVPGPTAARVRGRTRLVYAGNLGAGYDLKTVLAAVAEDPTLSLDIAGKGPQEMSLREEVRRRGLVDRVRFHGYLPSDALRCLLAASDVGLVPMRDDSWVGLPYKLGDYLAAGLPVLSSLHGECGDLLERECVGATYDFGSPTSLRAALATVPTDAVRLPACLDATRIYPDYVNFVKGKDGRLA